MNLKIEKYMIEVWKDIKNYEGLFQVSNFGQILSLNYHRTGKPKLLKPVKHPQGYLLVHLSKNGKSKMFKIHRLVAQTFLPNPDNLPQVNHKDENKANNRVDNLEWCDGKYNHNYGTRNERVSKTMTNGKTSKKVLQFSLTGEFIREWESTQECGRNGFNQGNISSCCLGERKSADGFKWQYA